MEKRETMKNLEAIHELLYWKNMKLEGKSNLPVHHLVTAL